MTRGTLFWGLMIIWLLFGFWFFWPSGGGNFAPIGNNGLIFVLLALLGWKVYGPAVKGD